MILIPGEVVLAVAPLGVLLAVPVVFPVCQAVLAVVVAQVVLVALVVLVVVEVVAVVTPPSLQCIPVSLTCLLPW